MRLTIKNPETERLARELAAATGESITVAVTEAVRVRLMLVRGELDTDDELKSTVGRRRAVPRRRPTPDPR